MPNLDIVTFEDIYSGILLEVKGDVEDEESLNKVKISINSHYRTIASKKKWKWLRETRRSLKMRKPYTTGQITLTEGSKIVTGVATDWNDTFRQWWLAPAGMDQNFRVIAVPSDTELLLASPYTGPTIVNGQYLLFQSEVALFPDLDDIDDVRIDGTRWRLEPKGPAEINIMRQRWPRMNGRPRFYTIEGEALFEGPVLGQFILGFDFLGKGMTKAIHFFPPIADKDYTIHIPYKIKVRPLVNPSDQPLIPVDHRIILQYYGKADWYASNSNPEMMRHYQRLGDDQLDDLIQKYVDTDDKIEFRGMKTGGMSHSRLMRGSQNYFDTEG